MAEIKPDKVNMVIVAKEKSPKSGKYNYFLGYHYNQGHSCWDVAAMNNWTGEITKRHHHSKAEALISWNHVLKELKRIAEQPEEEDERKLERKLIIKPNGEIIVQ